jgi:hypothetical protein
MSRQEASLSVQAFLSQASATTPETLFASYARSLLDSSGAWALPVPLDRITAHHGFHLRSASLQQRGFLHGDTIFVNSDDPLVVQRFSEGHELMESLAVALADEDTSCLPPGLRQTFRRDKERFCEQGAAELLLPAELVFPLVSSGGLTLARGREISRLCQTSVTATIRRMLEADMEPCIFALLKEGHRKSQVVPSQVGQGVLWGTPEEWDPAAELRVWKRWSSPQTQAFLCFNESFSRETSIYQTLSEGIVGEIKCAYEMLDLEHISDMCQTESMLVTIDHSDVVMALIHLPRSG